MIMSPGDWERFDALPEPVRRVVAHAGESYALDANLLLTVARAQAAGISDHGIAAYLRGALQASVEVRERRRVRKAA